MSWRQRFKRFVAWTVIVCVVLAAAGIAAYHSFALDPAGRTYVANLRPAADKLKRQCVLLSTQIDKRLIDSPPHSLAEITANIDALRSLSTQTRDELRAFNVVSDNFQTSPYLAYAKDYHKAAVLYNQSVAATKQISEVLDEYDLLINYLSGYYTQYQRLSDELNAFNSLTDLNVLTGTGYQLNATAADIRNQIQEIQKIAPPRGLVSVQEKSIAAHRHAAEGYDDLAVAVYPPVESLIDGAARKIESATEENDATREHLERTIETLPVFIHVKELAEKIERFKF